MNVEHERNLHLRWLLKRDGVLTDTVAAQLEVPWYSNGIIAQVVFFALTCVGFGAIVAMGPTAGIVGVIAVALAEFLILKRRWFFTGVEAALWICAMFGLISELPRSGTPESNLVMAAAAAIAGARVRNPLFGALAAIFVMNWAEERLDLGVLAAIVIAFGGCIALMRTWRRPSTEWLWIALALVMPIAGTFHADANWVFVTIALYTILGIVALVLALRRPHHALFLCAIASFAIAAAHLFDELLWSEETIFALSGVVLLAIAFAITRALRDRAHGFVLTPVQLTPADDAIEVAATLAMQPQSSAPAPESGRGEGGGQFGGAGASGDY